MKVTKIVNCTNLNSSKFPLKNIINTMKTNNLFPISGKLVIGLSGGADSVFLLIMAYHLLHLNKLNSILVIHINHGTRQENELEEKFCVDLCEKLSLQIIVKKLDLNLSQSSFEDYARKKRYMEFEKVLENNDFFATAHHLNDSFEWSLMNTFKTSSVDTLKGIPIKRDQFIKPLLTFSKREILNYLNEQQISFIVDLSNDNLKFERNYVRKEIVPLIEQRFPKYLKHFFLRSKSLIEHANNKFIKNEIYINHDPIGGILIQFQKYTIDVEQTIKKAFFSLSSVGRSSISLELSKIGDALFHGKIGPLTFPDQILIYLQKNTVYLIQKNKLNMFHSLDLKILKLLKIEFENLKTNQSILISASSLEKTNKEDIFFPQIVLIKNSLIKEKCKKRDQLLPISTRYLLDNGINFSYFGKLTGNRSKNIEIYPITSWTALAKS